MSFPVSVSVELASLVAHSGCKLLVTFSLVKCSGVTTLEIHLFFFPMEAVRRFCCDSYFSIAVFFVCHSPEIILMPCKTTEQLDVSISFVG